MKQCVPQENIHLVYLLTQYGQKGHNVPCLSENERQISQILKINADMKDLVALKRALRHKGLQIQITQISIHLNVLSV